MTEEPTQEELLMEECLHREIPKVTSRKELDKLEKKINKKAKIYKQELLNEVEIKRGLLPE
jgi:hypothetical protein|tara:strand:- start:720 stop:902 length:183 start_codon:yes stop_codon:yes gene_type:complete